MGYFSVYLYFNFFYQSLIVFKYRPLPGLLTFTDLLQKLTLASGTSHEVGICVGQAYGHWRCLWVLGLQANCPQQLMVRPLDGILDILSRIHIPLIYSIPRSGCWFSPRCLPSPSSAAHDLVFWMGQERNESLWQCVTQLGKWGTPSHTLT